MSDQLHAVLRAIECPDTPPTLAAAARRKASEIEDRTSHRRRMRTAALGASALVLVGVGFTAPGQAATEWIAGVAGIGDEPTLEHPYGVPGSVVVFGTGTAPDGTPFEIVAERQSAATLSERVRESGGDDEFKAESGVICPRIDFPSDQVSGGEFCNVLGRGSGPSGLSAMGYSMSRDNAGAPATFWGDVGPEVARVRVVLVTSDDVARELDVTLAHLSGELEHQVGADYPFGIFVSFPTIGAERALLEVIAYDDADDEIDRRTLPVGGDVGALPAHPPIFSGSGD